MKGENVFANRNFRLVFFGALVSELGAMLYNFAVSFYILEISGNSAFLQGFYLALGGVAMLVFTPVGGVLGDRFNKAKIMYVCDYLKGGSILLATLLMVLFPSPRAHIVILFALGITGSAVSGVFSPASGALFPHIVEAERLQQANAYFTIKSSSEAILGVILAGVLYASLPILTLFLLVGLCFIASGVSEMLIRYEHLSSPERLTLRLAVRDMGDGLRYLKTKRAILALLCSVLFINFFFAPVTANFLPYFIRTDLAAAPGYLFERLLTPEMWYSVVSVFFGVSSLLGAAILSGRPQTEKCGFRTALRLCVEAVMMIGLTLCYRLLAATGTSINIFLIALCLGAFVIGMFISFINIPISTAVMRIVDRDMLSKVNSIISIGSHGMIPISSVLAGLVLGTLGSTPLLAICSAGFTVTAVTMLLNRRIREI